MSLDNFVIFIGIATLLVMSPGPNGILIAKTVPFAGRRAGYFNILGFVAAFYLHGTFSALGISIVLMQSSLLFSIFKFAGAAYLIWLGVKALSNVISPAQPTIPSHTKAVKRSTPLRTAFIEGFITNALNPKVSMFYLAAFPQFIEAESNILHIYTLVTAHASINVVWFASMVLFIGRMGAMLGSARLKSWLSAVSGVIFIGFGIKLAMQTQK